MRLRQKDPDQGWPEFTGPGQTVLEKKANELLLEVCQVTSKADEPGTRPVKVERSLREYLEPNAIVQSDDVEVARIAREVAGKEIGAATAAFRLRDWVHANMSFDLGIALAPASETIRQRKGTCAAYAITLAALARAAGIPSRVVMGYAYVAGIWGGHAWVEMFTGDRWLALDGALMSAGPADAARIAGARTSLAEGAGGVATELTRLFGINQVTIVEYDVEGVCTKVAEGAPGFTIDGDTYRNPWLGLVWERPAGFRFARTDAVYPDTTVVAVEGPNGQRVCLRQEAAPPKHGDAAVAQVFRRLGFPGKPVPEELAGQPIANKPAPPLAVLFVEGPGKAALALDVTPASTSKSKSDSDSALAPQPDLWVLTAEGPQAGDLVRRAAARLAIRRSVQ
jgi:hypothetical protein